MGWVNTVDEWINEMERVLKCFQKALDETKNWKKEKKKLKGMKNRIIVNIWLIRVLKEKKIFEELLTEIVPRLKKDWMGTNTREKREKSNTLTQ